MSDKKPTMVISFRVPVEMGKQIDRQAKRAKKKRAKFVESLFVPNFENLVSVTESLVKSTG